MKTYLECIVPWLIWLYEHTCMTVTLLTRDGHIVAHAGGGVDACRGIRQNVAQACHTSDEQAMEKIMSGLDVYEYVCHVGISEIVAAVRAENGELEGYLMMGKFLSKEKIGMSQGSPDGKDIDASVLQAEFRELPVLDENDVQNAIGMLKFVARKIGDLGYLELFRDPVVVLTIKQTDQRRKDKMTCADLQALTHMDPHTLIRIFEKYFGVKPHVFIGHRRMLRAEDELTNSGLSVDKISEELGYKCTSSFTTFFKQQYGEPPGNFRMHSGDKHYDTAYEADILARKGKVPFSNRPKPNPPKK